MTVALLPLDLAILKHTRVGRRKSDMVLSYYEDCFDYETMRAMLGKTPAERNAHVQWSSTAGWSAGDELIRRDAL